MNSNEPRVQGSTVFRGSTLSMRKRIGGWLGEVMLRWQPDLQEQSEQVFATSSLKHRLVKAALYRRAFQNPNPGQLAQLHQTYWLRGGGERYYEEYPDRSVEHLQTFHAQSVRHLQKVVERNPGAFTNLCEIGCGNGRALKYYADVLPSVRTFVGVDLSEKQILKNRELPQDPRITFVQGDGLKWMKEHASEGVIVATNGGVLEYSTEAQVLELFDWMARRTSPVAMMLVEPLAEDFDLETEMHSRPYGAELTFSHPYQVLIRMSGLRLHHAAEARTSSGRFVSVVASNLLS